jgi:hypothetical protein
MSLARSSRQEELVNKKNDPLDGSVSGTIGGGGAESGGPTSRPKGPDVPRPNPDDAASGRLAPDPLNAAEEGSEIRVDMDVDATPSAREADDADDDRTSDR